MSSSDQSVKVGYVLKRFPRLSETFILNEILALERLGIEAEIFSLKKPLEEPRDDRLKQLRARVTYIASDSDGDASIVGRWDTLLSALIPSKPESQRAALAYKAAAIGRLARHRGVRHLHAHFASDAAAVALLAARVGGLPFSFTAHARDIFHNYGAPEADDASRRLKIAEAAFVTTVSDYNKAYLRKLAGPDADRIIRLYNGIDLDRFSPTPHGAPEARTILSVARLVEKKGIGDLVEACRILKQGGVHFSCTIIGDGPLEPVLRAQIQAADLHEHVTLRGACTPDAVLEAMRGADVFALPCVVAESGDQDGLPTVLLEALGVGVAAVSTRVAGIPEIVEHGKTGVLVEPSQPDALAAALQWLLEDPVLRRSLGHAGRAVASHKFDVDVNAAELMRLFQYAIVDSGPKHQEPRDAHRLSLR